MSLHSDMNDVPERIGDAVLIAFTHIDGRHRPTGACRHVVGGELMNPAAGLAICKYEVDPGYYLFYCDVEWNPVTDTYHGSVEAAKEQAATEYEGVSDTWAWR